MNSHSFTDFCNCRYFVESIFILCVILHLSILACAPECWTALDLVYVIEGDLKLYYYLAVKPMALYGFEFCILKNATIYSCMGL